MVRRQKKYFRPYYLIDICDFSTNFANSFLVLFSLNVYWIDFHLKILFHYFVFLTPNIFKENLLIVKAEIMLYICRVIKILSFE